MQISDKVPTLVTVVFVICCLLNSIFLFIIKKEANSDLDLIYMSAYQVLFANVILNSLTVNVICREKF